MGNSACPVVGTQHMAAAIVTTDSTTCELSGQCTRTAGAQLRLYLRTTVRCAHTDPPPAAHRTPGRSRCPGTKETQQDRSAENSFYIMATGTPLLFFGFLWGTSCPRHLDRGFGQNWTPAPGWSTGPKSEPANALHFPGHGGRLLDGTGRCQRREMQSDVCQDDRKTFFIPCKCKRLPAWNCRSQFSLRRTQPPKAGLCT